MDNERDLVGAPADHHLDLRARLPSPSRRLRPWVADPVGVERQARLSLYLCVGVTCSHLKGFDQPLANEGFQGLGLRPPPSRGVEPVLTQVRLLRLGLRYAVLNKECEQRLLFILEVSQERLALREKTGEGGFMVATHLP